MNQRNKEKYGSERVKDGERLLEYACKDACLLEFPDNHFDLGKFSINGKITLSSIR